MKETIDGFAVMLRNREKLAYLAHGKGAGHFVAYTRKRARDYRDELTPHLGQKGKIVPVKVTYEWQQKGPR